ncbi:restriction endonuclease type II-like protein [Armillaria mellea]|nr:restriction endonuclease type II-like protein [Armillaria mellea]
MASNGASSSNMSRLVSVSNPMCPLPIVGVAPNILAVSRSQTDAGPSRTSNRPVAMARSQTMPASSPTRNRTRNRPRLSHAIPNLPSTQTTDNASVDPRTFIPFDPVTFRARTYEIVLIIDTREIKDQQNRDYFKVQLENRGIKVEVRALVLADACWIARKINPAGDEMDEVVLDAIVERKTLKDLHTSIVKDKRFHEQKFRLHQSGITHVYYLVENYKVDHALKEYELQINTALSSTQVVDGFMVKETRNTQDTITWYVGVHKGLTDAYQDKDLHIIPSTSIRRHNYLEMQRMLRDRHPDRVYLTTFTQFQFLNSKNGFTTVSTVWAKMLLSVHGLSPEKVGAILSKYPTPMSLYVAFCEAEDIQRVMQQHEDSNGGPQVPEGKRKARSNVPRAELLLADINRESGRPIGDALSKKIYMLLMSDDYASDE